MELYKYGSSGDRWMVRMGLFFSLASGCIQPTYAIIIGKIVEIFNPETTTDDKSAMMNDFIWQICAISVATFLASYLGYALLQISSERLAMKLREKYLTALMRQEVAYFEG